MSHSITCRILLFFVIVCGCRIKAKFILLEPDDPTDDDSLPYRRSNDASPNARSDVLTLLRAIREHILDRESRASAETGEGESADGNGNNLSDLINAYEADSYADPDHDHSWSYLDALSPSEDNGELQDESSFPEIFEERDIGEDPGVITIPLDEITSDSSSENGFGFRERLTRDILEPDDFEEDFSEELYEWPPHLKRNNGPNEGSFQDTDDDDFVEVGNYDGKSRIDRDNGVLFGDGEWIHGTRDRSIDFPPDKRNVITMPKTINAHVGVLLFIDNSIYRYHKSRNGGSRQKAIGSIKEYYGAVFAMANQIYKNIKDPYLSMRLAISGILIAENRRDVPWVEYLVKWTDQGGKVNANKALERFRLYLKKNALKLPKYDHAVSFTRHRLVNSRDSNVEGMTQRGSMCKTSDGSSSSIIHDRGDFNCYVTVAHEIGHSLGASHDGDSKNRDCPRSDNYVMASMHSTGGTRLRNTQFFSKCSIRQMNELLRSQGQCVEDDPIIHYQHDFEGNLPGRKISVNEQCFLSFGPYSVQCPAKEIVKKMCLSLWCMDSRTPTTCTTRSSFAALPGTTCGEGMVCYGKECIQDTGNWKTNTLKTRPLPQSSGFTMDSHKKNHCKFDENPDYCKQIIKAKPNWCKRPSVRIYCCFTCTRGRV